MVTKQSRKFILRNIYIMPIKRNRTLTKISLESTVIWSSDCILTVNLYINRFVSKIFIRINIKNLKGISS